MIDWSLASRVARLVAGPAPPAIELAADLAHLATDSERRVVSYSGLSPAAPLPTPEAVDRAAWIDANLQGLRPVLDPVAGRVGRGLGELSGPVRLGAGVVLAAQVGALTGYLAQRVMGQYELVLVDPSSPARLLFVAPNLEEAARALDADRAELLAWVAFHEVTHAVQFAAVPWLREHLADTLRELIASLEVTLDPGRLARVPTMRDLRSLVEAVREGGLIALVADGDRRDLIDRLQATMALVEGYAEHVMDMVGEDILPSLPQLRERLDRRRRTRSTPLRLLERLLGIELKLRQYELGKRFCDAVVDRGGIAALNRAWEGPAEVPTLEELEDPDGWLARIGPAALDAP